MKKNIASQLGFLASVLGAVIGGIYLLILIYAILTEGFVLPPAHSCNWLEVLLLLLLCQYLSYYLLLFVL